MSNVISSFLVGIGFDYDKKSAEQIGTGIDSIKSKALQLGAVVAGAFGIKALTADFAQSRDMLGKFAEVFGVSANDVQAFGNALATEGGTLESFMAQLESIERARARIRVGDVGFFAPAGKAGINPNDIANAESATAAYLGLADAFAGMNQQQRINAAEALGLDEASIRLLSQGRDAVEQLVAKYGDIRPVTADMTESAAEFNRQWLEASQNVAGLADTISRELLPIINDITKSVNSWFGENRSALGGFVKATFGSGDPKEIAEATGLPEWLFKPISQVQEDVFGKPIAVFDPGASLEKALQRGREKQSASGSPDTSALDMLSPVGNYYNQPVVEQSAPSEDVQEAIRMLNTAPPVTQGMFVRPESERSAPASSTTSADQKPAPSTQNINVSLNIDGQVIDRRVVKVVDGMAQTALDDLVSSTGA